MSSNLTHPYVRLLTCIVVWHHITAKLKEKNDATCSKGVMLLHFELVFGKGNRIANLIRYFVKKYKNFIFYFLSLTWKTFVSHLLLNVITDCMERIFLEKLIVPQLVKNFPAFWNPKIHYLVHNSQQVVPILAR
jgi:hypothetical protein